MDGIHKYSLENDGARDGVRDGIQVQTTVAVSCDISNFEFRILFQVWSVFELNFSLENYQSRYQQIISNEIQLSRPRT